MKERLQCPLGNFLISKRITSIIYTILRMPFKRCDSIESISWHRLSQFIRVNYIHLSPTSIFQKNRTCSLNTDSSETTWPTGVENILFEEKLLSSPRAPSPHYLWNGPQVQKGPGTIPTRSSHVHNLLLLQCVLVLHFSALPFSQFTAPFPSVILYEKLRGTEKKRVSQYITLQTWNVFP